MNSNPRVSFDELYGELRRVLLALGFRQDRAALCARLFAESSRDGVYSHGLNRFPRFVKMIQNGAVDVEAEPECVGQLGAFEQWDGHQGAGNLNAYAGMERAMELARTHGVGVVGLRNTNHWMRGGTYGWQAAEAGMVGVCWTNTMQNMPPWGGKAPRIGNNPIIMAVPRSEGHVVLDMAMAQFSYGALASYRKSGEPLPIPGGYDADGNLTRDAAAIDDAWRPLPIGYWKGSGLSILLDMTAAVLSGGLAVHQITPDSERETCISQVFIALNPGGLIPSSDIDALMSEIVDHLHASEPAEGFDGVRYPGEGTLATRRENDENGIPVDQAIWGWLTAFA